tara:strand:+ start:505 stop:1260 length:756 start_codon:yes stop_codon:yes gene_type:complete
MTAMNQEQMMMAAMQQGMQQPQVPEQPAGDIVGDESVEAKKGQATDTVLAHLTAGEIVIPVEMLQSKKDLAIVTKLFERMGVNINEFTVGHEDNKMNPETGHPEFFFKSVGRFFKRQARSFTKAANKAGLGGILPTFLQEDRLRGMTQDEIRKADARMQAQLADYERKIDSQVADARAKGEAQMTKMRADANVSGLKFQKFVKQTMKSERPYQSGSDAGATAEGGVSKSQAKFKRRRKRVKRSLKQGGRPS